VPLPKTSLECAYIEKMARAGQDTDGAFPVLMSANMDMKGICYHQWLIRSKVAPNPRPKGRGFALSTL